MAIYKSSEITVPASANDVYSKLSNMENLRSLLDKIPADRIPADQRKAFEEIEVTEDSITFPAGPVGTMTFRVVEKEQPSFVKLKGEGAPVPLTLALHVNKETDSSSKAFVEIDIEIPALLKPMVGGQIQKMADQFGEMLKSISFS